ncbi:phage tail sheath C-terminal domain-containing protein [Chitinophaga alhagiae]|uniref:phage tail sheath C-terminal domain-containing protein n=1 Tax=Chitinophaga alhagiae TaxID=2203219 RepID=UPI000E5B44EC|nr:phage tail sheath C-terminal domain-containing protein [Chitinophaga alhagiae]
MLNLTAIKTPGVYIDEVPKFPPSIAAVETAIPAFIGYTEKAAKLAPQDLYMTPLRIGSIADYELYFGGAPKPSVSDIQLDLANQFVSAKISNQKFLYDALRLFYANGGGDCYIVSVGLHTETPDKARFQEGIQALEKYDEPTILLFPDAALLPLNGLYDVQKSALQQCDELKDRVGLFDLKQKDYNGAEFRDQIGINSLKYGMAYTPWIQVTLNKNVTYDDIKGNVNKAGNPVADLKTLTTDANVQAVITDLDNLKTDAAKIATDTGTLTGNTSLLAAYNKKIADLLATPNVANLEATFAYLYSIAETLNGYTAFTNADLQTSAQTTITNIGPRFTEVIKYEEEVAAGAGIAGYTAQKPAGATVNAPEWGTVFTVSPGPSAILQGATDTEKIQSLIPYLETAFSFMLTAYQSGILDASINLSRAKNDALTAGFPVYKSIISGINNTAAAIPPSGAIAGIYAFVDNNRGVWKAPANVSLAGVDAPDHIYTASELDRLNVDVVSGKSINAIRPFTGKGTLVFGARTLAGNDNEWRYVSVRRFFNMVEESTKKATEQFVFESNDANSWVRVQAMIENFLTTLWRQGALQGSTTDKAFYVAVGLGKTMTALDILEGRMIVEIGMAVVRPAEFIILRFSHKMPEA